MSLPTSGRPLVSEQEKPIATTFTNIGDPWVKPPGTPNWRLQCPVVWKRISFVGDGVTRDFGVGSYYVSTYLRVFINGVRQKPTTHFTETDVEAGTLNLVQAPRTNDNIEIEWAEYCDSDLAPSLPAGTDGLPIKYKNPALLGTGPGKRVYVAGTDGTPSVKFAWTENIYAASPSWTANNTGLPGIEDTTSLYIDPWSPSTTGYIHVQNADGGTSSILYKNTTMRSGGSWAAILDKATVNTLLGTAYTTVLFEDIQLTAAQAGLIYVVVSTNNVFFDYLFHSHDRGTTWSATELPPTGGATNKNYYSLQVGQRNGNLVYILGDLAAGSQRVVSSTDGGHTVSVVSTEAGNATPPFLGLPYEGNNPEATIYRGRSTSALEKSINSGVTWAAYSAALRQPRFSASSSLLAWDFGADLYISRDGGLTYTTTTVPGSIFGASLLRDVTFYMVLSGNTVQTAPAQGTTTLTNRTGNLITGVFTGAAPVLYGIVPDWTT